MLHKCQMIGAKNNICVHHYIILKVAASTKTHVNRNNYIVMKQRNLIMGLDTLLVTFAFRILSILGDENRTFILNEM